MKTFSMIILSVYASMFGLGIKIEAAEQYPVKPITFIVSVEAGSDADVLARPLCQKASSILGQSIVVVNKPGAGSSIGYRELYGAKPDGYTIGMGNLPLITNKLQGTLPYDHEGFSIIGTYATYIPIIVASTRTQRPFKIMEEVLSFAKSHPNEVSIATSNVGGGWWIATMAFQAAAGVKFNIIPQPGAAAFAITQVAGGHTDLGIVALGTAKPQIEAGNIRFLAVFGSRRPHSPYDNVPALKEIGYDISVESTQTVIGPPKMPRDVTDKLAKVFEIAANDQEYQKFTIERNALPFHLPPEKAVRFLNEQRTVCRLILEKAGILKMK